MRCLPRVILLTLTAVALAFVWTVQPDGANQNANFALTRSLAHGSPQLDTTGSGPAAIPTHDVVRHDGHWYAAKPPGLAAASILPFMALEAIGVETTGDVTRPLWALHLWGVVLPALILLILVQRLGDRIEPGYGLFAAVALGLATLVLPFANLFFVHVLAATLGFAAFALLWHERHGPSDLRLLGLAGLLAGLAAVVDYPLALLTFALLPYAAARVRPVPRVAVYGASAAVGAALILLYNRWAFGSPLHFPYEGWAEAGDEPRAGLFGATVPSLRVLLELLFVPAGLATLAPAVVGLVLLYRRGMRAEALTIGLVATLFLLHNAASVENPFGGASPGPRHLIPILPFLVVPLAVAARRLSGPVLALSGAAAVVLLVYTATTPLAAGDGKAWRRLLDGDVVPTVVDPFGIEGLAGVVPLFVLGIVATGIALAATPLELSRRQLVAGVVALASWLTMIELSNRLLFDGPAYGPLVVAFAATVATAAVYAVLAHRAGGRSRFGLRGDGATMKLP